MTWHVDLILYVVLVVTALAALEVQSLLAASVILTAFSFVSALLMLSVGAVDVAFTEAVVGAGLVGVFYIVAIFRITRRNIH